MNKKKCKNLMDKVPCSQSYAKFKYIIFGIIIAAILTYYLNKQYNTMEGLIAIEQLYSSIEYGQPDYCTQIFYPENITNNLRERIIGQDDAIDELNEVLNRKHYITTIALTGTTGTGKSLMKQNIAYNFPWTHNIFHGYWDSDIIPESRLLSENEKYDRKFSYLKELNRCGYNLVLIDSLKYTTIDLIDYFNREIIPIWKIERYKVIVLYIFSLRTYGEENLRLLPERQLLFKDIPVTKHISLRILTKDDVKKCIEKESLLNNISLSAENVEKLMKVIQPLHSGCKNVRAKVLVYGD